MSELTDDIAFIMDDLPERDDDWLRSHLEGPRKGVVRLSGITVPKTEIIANYLKAPTGTAYLPWRKEEVTARRIEFTTGKHSPLVFHALLASFIKYGRFEEGLEAVELIEKDFLFGLAPTVGTQEINPITAHFIKEREDLFIYYVAQKEKLDCYSGLSRSSLYKHMAHIAALQKMVAYSKLVADLPIKMLKDEPLPAYKWLKDNAE